MTYIEFENYLEGQLNRIKEVLASKAGEYATDTDRFHNFVVAGKMDNETPERALWGMLKKHIVSVRDLVSSLDHSKLLGPHEIDMWQEKCGDMINYGLLLLGMAYDRKARGK